MMKFVMPIILIAIGVSVFFVFANPMYNDITTLRTQTAAFNEALNNSKKLENERDALTTKENSINPDDKIKLIKLLPDNVDNIRLILEIGQIASPYGMILKNVKYSTTTSDANTASTSPGVVQGGGMAKAANKDYGVWNLEFSTQGSYSNFLNFTRDLERNLRIVDISSIDFSSATSSPINSSAGESYTYNYKVKTYWLKN